MSKHTTPRLSKRKKKIIENNQKQEEAQLNKNFSLKDISPLTENQSLTWDAFYSNKNLLLHGMAGTGKSFISLFLSLREVFDDDLYNRIVIVRSIVPTRDIGYLPGSIVEKIKVYEDPYRQIFTELFGRSDAYDHFKQKHLVEFLSTSFVRGTTFNNCIVLIDEMQNMDWGELSSVITRAGDNCKIIFCGDHMQSDFRNKERFNKDDVLEFMEVLKRMEQFQFIEFGIDDIVRSRLVKSFIIESTKIGRDIV